MKILQIVGAAAVAGVVFSALGSAIFVYYKRYDFNSWNVLIRRKKLEIKTALTKGAERDIFRKPL